MSGQRLSTARRPVPHDWLVPDWPAPPQVRALCTTRSGGVSAPPWNSLNLGDHVGDAAEAVAANRRVLQEAIGARPVFLNQVHASGVVELDAHMRDGSSADGCATSERRLACTIMVADCLPVLFSDVRGTRVAAAHAGWRGLARGVLAAVLKHFCAPAPGHSAIDASEVIAWLGPCIGPPEFEVGDEVRRAFDVFGPHAEPFFVARATQRKWLADLAGLARLQLHTLRVAQIHGNDSGAGWCTVRDESRFFSHRRDHPRFGASGRFAACVWLDG